MNGLKSEWIKLRSTKSLWITSALVIILSVLLTVLTAWGLGLGYTSDIHNDESEIISLVAAMVDPTIIAAGFGTLGIAVIAIQAVLSVTAEYSTNTMKATLLGSPVRWRVPVAKFVVYGLFAALLSLVTLLISFLSYRWMLGVKVKEQAIFDQLQLSAPSMDAVFYRHLLYVPLLVLLCIGVGLLLRNSAGAIALMVLWATILEDIIGSIPKVPDFVTAYLPFNNAHAFLALHEVDKAPWGQWGSLLYFGVWALVIFVAGVLALQKRDA